MGSKLVLSATIIGLLCLGLVACTSGVADESRPPTSEEDVDGSTAGDDDSADVPRSRLELKPTITLAVTDWTGARLNVAIAEKIIELRLGYPVEAIEMVDTGKIMSDLQSGELDAVLELWPSSLEPEERELLESGSVARLGDLGVVGKIGWYVPRFVIEDDPSLAAWQGFDNSAVAARFATAETGARGRFLGTAPNYEQADEQIVAALDLPFEVVYSGSDEATATEVARSIQANEPVLLYWWTPTAEISRFDLVEVSLPPRTAICEADIEAGRAQSCDYAPEPLLKVGSPELSAKAPDIWQFLLNFQLSTEDQLDLIDRVENKGASIDVVAQEWVTNHPARWEQWLL
ncbi:MAG: glycine betaine ABC transporter substrate-binding protein [Acidimicrobiales bacterium]